MKTSEVDTLEAAVMSTLRSAREFGTWDCDWYDYAPNGWMRRVRNAPRALVESTGRYLASERPHFLFELVAEVDRLIALDHDFAKALVALHRRDNTPFCLAEVFAHHENELRGAA